MADGLCAPFDHNLVIERLRDQVKVLKHVGGAAELGTITQLRDFRTPAAYVLLAKETPYPSPPATPVARPGRWQPCTSPSPSRFATTATTKASLQRMICAPYSATYARP
ncbi:phage tail terminator protein [Pseudomonas aeruginosa]